MMYMAMGFWSWFFVIIFWIFFIWLILKLIMISKARQGKDWREERFMEKTMIKQDPINILKTRYAKGEITKKEYEEMKGTLMKE